jgi:peroxiredoxin (alkyl hydroperoxide reductase subunit C)
VTLSEYRGNKNVVLVFYPLAFSPACSLQLPAIERKIVRFEELGATVLGISVDSHHANSVFAERLRLSFQLLSDFNRETSAAYGVLIPEAGFSQRAMFVVDRHGTVVHKEVSVASADPARIPSIDRALAVLAGLE